MFSKPSHQAVLSRRRLLAAMLASSLPVPYAMAAGSPRVVSLDYGLASTLLALGIVPVGISELAGWDKWVVEPPIPKGVVDLGSSLELDLEILLALKPDLIVTTPFLDDLLPKLRSIAEVLRVDIYSEDSGPLLPASIRATRTLASRIGRSSEAETFLAEADATFTDCRQRLLKIAPASLALIDFIDARHARIYGMPGILGGVLDQLGVQNAWQGTVNYWGFQTIAIEDLSRVADIDASLVVFDPIPGDVLPKLANSPLWQALPFARPGHLHRLPTILLFGMVNEATRFARLLTELLERKI